MEKKAVSGMMLTLLLISMLALRFNVPSIKASGTIYIRADGSIDPPTANITTTDKVTYTFTGNNYDMIVVQRSNIIIDGAGYTLQGPGTGSGFYWSINNVTIRRTSIKSFIAGIDFTSSSGNSISGNNITNNYIGIALFSCSGNSVSGNNITANNDYGIYLESSNNNSFSGNNITSQYGHGIFIRYMSNNNSISGNNITANNDFGIYLDHYSNNNSVSGNNITANNDFGILLYYYSNNNSVSGNNITNSQCGIGLLDYSDNNNISGNNIANNYYGIYLYLSSGSKFYHNNFIANVLQVSIHEPWYPNSWDDGYPSGGNYWSDYTGVDANGDGIGDTPYVIDIDNQDNYPLMTPYVFPDINRDGIVDKLDLEALARAYGSTPGKPNWNPNCDINDDNKVDVFDLFILSKNYGKTHP